MIIVAIRAPTKINVAMETAMVIAQIMQLPARLSECERADSKRLSSTHSFACNIINTPQVQR